MSLRDDIKPYIDVNGLVAPNRCDPKTRGSDNGPLFTSEYLVIYSLNTDLIDVEKAFRIKACIDQYGYLHRAPNDLTDDTPDDHYGVLAMRRLLRLNFKVKLKPSCWHPALLYLWSPWFIFLSPVVAIIIACSNFIGGNESHELLTWMLIQGTKRDPFCYVAGRLWLARKNVPEIFARYFEDGHPFVKYVMEERI